METPDVLVVTKSDLGQVASATRRDLAAALRALGNRSTRVLSVSALPPAKGIEELIEAIIEHRAGLDLPKRRLRSRRAGALSDFVLEHGERGLRAVGGRGAAEALLAEQDPALEPAALVELLSAEIGGAAS
jgi:LAO/AO transport system kinase